MKRLSTVFASIIILSTAFAAAEEATSVEVVLPAAAARHQGEIEAKRTQWQRSMDFGAAEEKSWAPIPEPSPIDVLHYDLDLYLDVSSRRMSGTAAITLAAVNDGLSEVELDVDLGLRVLAVVALADEAYPSDSPRSLKFSHADDLLTITLPRTLSAGEQIRLMIPYGGRGGRFGYGINWSTHAGGFPAIFTFAEPFGARMWFPSNDRPDDKATADLTVTSRDDLTVASNGLEVDRVDNGDGTVTTSWSSQYQVATYLVVMNLSDYAFREWTYDTQAGGTMPVVAYMYPESAAAGEVDLAITPDIIETLASAFGEYPFVEEKYGNLTANFGGGMEHQTLTTIGVFFGDPWMEWLNVHETGHQWWGDWVTCDDWRELWLNEGFATYSEFVWSELEYGPDHLLQYTEDADWAQSFNGPLYDNPVPFSRTIYDKGGLVVRMLRDVMGDAAFHEGLIAFRDTFAEDSATTEGLRAVMETVSEMDLEWFFDQWVYGKNRPRLQYDWQAVAGPAVRLTVTQKHSNADLFRIPMDIRVTTASGTEDHRIWIEAEASQTIDIPVSADPTAVELDPNRIVVAHLSHASQPDIDFGPDAPDLDFGQVSGTEISTLTMPVTNTGGSTLQIEGTGFYNGSYFDVASPTEYPVMLEPGESVDLIIEFSSTAAGPVSDWIGVASNDPSYADGVALIPLQGRGARFEDPTLVAPSTANAGSAPIGGMGETTVLVRNFGAGVLTLAAAIEGDAFSLGSVIPAQLEGGDDIAAYVSFRPMTTGQHTGTLTLFTNDPAKPEHVIALSGNGVGAPRIELDPAPVTFGLASESDSLALTVGNSGTEDLVVSGLTVDGPFSLVDMPDLPLTVAPGAEDLTSIAIDGQKGSDLRGSLVITSNDPSLPRAIIPVSGHILETDEVESWSVPAAASAPGLGGAQWTSQAYLLNPTAEDMVIDLGFRPTASRTSSDATMTLPAFTQRSVADLVAATGNSGVGGIAIGATGTKFVGVTRTFSSEDSGTYGQFIPALGDDEIQSGDVTYVLGGLAGNGGFHTNFGVLNLGDGELNLDYEIHRPGGAVIGQGTLTAAARGYRQINEIYSDVTSLVIRGGFLTFRSEDPAARFAAFGSVVDDGSHDPTLVLPVAVTGSEPGVRYVPVVASNPGTNDTMWRSDVTVVNLNDVGTQVELILHQGGSTSLLTLGLGGTRAHLFEDIVRESFRSTGSGWLELEITDSNVVVFSRTYNDDASGTFGQNVPAISADEAIGSGEFVYLAGLSSVDGFRTNIGLTSLAEVDTTVTIRVYDDNHELLGTIPVTVGAGRFVQLQRVLSQQLGYFGTAWATVTSADADARFVAHASVVDGDSGDPVYIPAARR